MRRKASILLLFITVLKLAKSQYGCNFNEDFSSFINPCNTCDIRGFCPQYVGAGCDCFPGHLRNNLGICVTPEACDGPYNVREFQTQRRCGPNEEYRTCGSACPPTCEVRNEPCTLQCVSGCFCRTGLVRQNGMCIPPEQCSTYVPTPPNLTRYTPRTIIVTPQPPPRSPVTPYGRPPVTPYGRPSVVPVTPKQRCGPYAEYSECGSACPPTCERPKPEVCIQICISGCFCQKGYIRKGRMCVRPQECNTSQINPRYYHGGTPSPVIRPPSKPTPAVPYPVDVSPPVNVTPSPPSNTRGCPDRRRCNRYCRSIGAAGGFCVGPRFLQCNCVG